MKFLKYLLSFAERTPSILIAKRNAKKAREDLLDAVNNAVKVHAIYIKDGFFESGEVLSDKDGYYVDGDVIDPIFFGNEEECKKEIKKKDYDIPPAVSDWIKECKLNYMYMKEGIPSFYISDHYFTRKFLSENLPYWYIKRFLNNSYPNDISGGSATVIDIGSLSPVSTLPKPRERDDVISMHRDRLFHFLDKNNVYKNNSKDFNYFSECLLSSDSPRFSYRDGIVTVKYNDFIFSEKFKKDMPFLYFNYVCMNGVKPIQYVDKKTESISPKRP